MASELNMPQVQEYKYEIERLARELQDVKKKYYTQKRKEQQARSVLKCSVEERLQDTCVTWILPLG